MVSPHSATGRWAALAVGALFDAPLRTGWWTAYLLVIGLPIVLVGRRISHSFPEPPSVPVLLGVVWTVLAGCLALRYWGPGCALATVPQKSTSLVLGGLSAACLLLLVSLTMPATPLAGVVLAWSSVVAAETHWWTRRWRGTGGRVASSEGGPRDTGWQVGDELPLDSLPAAVTQQMIRERSDRDGEVLRGALRADFAAGEKVHVVHLVFCPPFPGPPEFIIEPTDGPDAEVETVQVACYGARVEIRLGEVAAEPTSVVVHYEAALGGEVGEG